MNTQDEGGCAFPFSALAPEGPYVYEDSRGMSLRDYFAAAALTSLIAEALRQDHKHWDGTAQHAYFIADAMLAERAK